MADELRVKPPAPCEFVIHDGQRYPTDHQGVAHIPESTGVRQAKGADVLGAVSVSLSHLDLPELRCVDCGRRKLALMGSVCAHCGGHCVPL